MIKYNIIQDKHLLVKCFLFYNVMSLAKLRDNCETKQKIEFSVKYLTVFRI